MVREEREVPNGIASVGLDRISNLPEDIITEILQHMPVRDAIKTSLLSKGWKNKWRSVPELIVNAQSIPCKPERSQHTELVRFVNCFLRKHIGKISKFQINNSIDSCSDIDDWIDILSRKKVNHLALFFNEYNPYPLPRCVFRCQALQSLQLQGCTLNLPLEYTGFIHLRSLALARLSITSMQFERLISEIPVLAEMRILCCSTLNHINIQARNLEDVMILGRYKSIQFQNTEKLTFVVIKTKHRKVTSCRLDDKILGGMQNVRSLYIFHPFIQFSWHRTAEKFETTFCNLSLLYLDVNFQNPKQILALLYLCKSSPYLIKLNIRDIEDKQAVVSYDGNLWEGLQCKKSVFHHLKTVIFDRFKGGEAELRFSEFILVNAIVLEKFRVQFVNTGITESQKLYAVEKLKQLYKASSCAELIL